MARHVVTGGAGFIGSHISEALVGRGDEVVVLDDLSTGHEENLAGFKAGVDFRKVDVAGEPDLARHLAGADTVFHQAAIPSVPRSVKDPVASHRANVEGSLAVLMACREAGVRRVVYASSSSVYGDSETLPKHEEMPAKPLSPYAAQKYFAEVYMQVFWRTYGLETVALRYFNVFGPRQDPTSMYSGVIAKFITAALRGERPTIFGDGLQSRDFTYIANVVDANLKASAAEGVEGMVFNAACGDRISVLDMLAGVQKVVGTSLKPIHEEPRKGDVRDSQAANALAKKHLGWSPVMSFEEGLRHTIDWYREQG